MTYESFMNHLADYYGQYRETTKAGSYVLRYLKKDIKEDSLSKLLETVLYYCRLSDYAPGISDIEYAIKRSASEGKHTGFHITKETGEAQRIKKHKEDILSIPEEERIDFKSEGELFKMLFNTNNHNTPLQA